MKRNVNVDWYDYRLNIFAAIASAAALGSGSLLGSKFEIAIGIACALIALFMPPDTEEEEKENAPRTGAHPCV